MTCTICDADLILSTWTFDEVGNLQSNDDCKNSAHFVDEEDFCKCFDLSTDDWKSICRTSDKNSSNVNESIVVDTTIVCLCAKCGGAVDKFKSLYEQLNRIQMELSAVRGNLLMEIVSKPSSSSSSQLNPLNNNNPFRQFMQNRFSPAINTKGLDVKKRTRRIKKESSTNYSENDVEIDLDMEFDHGFEPHESFSEQSSCADDDDDNESKKVKRNKIRKKPKSKVEDKERGEEKRIKMKPEIQATQEISPGVFRFREKWDFEQLEGLKVKCLSCQQIFPRRSKVIFHIMKHHDLEKIRCETCKKSWKTQILLDTHNCRPRQIVRQFKTKELEDGKTVIYDGKWMYVKIDETRDVYQCGVCGVPKRGKKVMNTHIKERHIDPARYVCDLCGRAFGSKKHFLCHLELHSVEKYVCDECGHVAKTRATLYLHKQTHSTWLCPYCQHTYTRKRGLKVHVQTYHANELAADIENPPSPLNKILLPPPIPNININIDNTSTANLDNSNSTGEGTQKRRLSKISSEPPVHCPNCRRRYATSKTLAVHLDTCRITEMICPEPECVGRAAFESYEPYQAHMYRHRKHKEKQQQQEDDQQQAQNEQE